MFLIRMISEFFSLIEAILIALVLAILISIFVIQPYKVDGSSMEPTLEGFSNGHEEQTGDHVIVLKTPYMLGKAPEFGDIVVVDSRVTNVRGWKEIVLESPVLSLLDASSSEGKHNWIKRVVGEPGDVVQVKNGVLYRNGDPVEEEYIKETIRDDFPPYTVPDDAVFVMGDNRNGSTDSRVVGSIPMENVIGKVVLRYFPFDRIANFY